MFPSMSSFGITTFAGVFLLSECLKNTERFPEDHTVIADTFRLDGFVLNHEFLHVLKELQSITERGDGDISKQP